MYIPPRLTLSSSNADTLFVPPPPPRVSTRFQFSPPRVAFFVYNLVNRRAASRVTLLSFADESS